MYLIPLARPLLVSIVRHPLRSKGWSLIIWNVCKARGACPKHTRVITYPLEGYQNAVQALLMAHLDAPCLPS